MLNTRHLREDVYHAVLGSDSRICCLNLTHCISCRCRKEFTWLSILNSENFGVRYSTCNENVETLIDWPGCCKSWLYTTRLNDSQIILIIGWNANHTQPCVLVNRTGQPEWGVQHLRGRCSREIGWRCDCLLSVHCGCLIAANTDFTSLEGHWNVEWSLRIYHVHLTLILESLHNRCYKNLGRACGNLLERSNVVVQNTWSASGRNTSPHVIETSLRGEDGS